MDLKNIEKKLSNFSSIRDWDQFHSVKNLSMALSVECAELLEIVQWMSEDESNQLTSEHPKYQNVKDEVADVFLYLVRICQKTGIDLERACLEKIEKNELKYPVELSKGNASKYTDLKK